MDKKQRYDVFLLVFGGMFAAGCAWVGLCPSAWVLALAPVLGVLGAAASWCVLARFALCRREAWLEKSFTRPLKLLLCPLLWLLYTLAVLGLAPAAPAGQEDLAAALVAAEQANAAKSDFLSRMSHEIRTPMNAIIGMSTIAAQSTGDDEQVEGCISKIGISSRFLLSLINDILDMSRIESGKMLLKNEKIPTSIALLLFII